MPKKSDTIIIKDVCRFVLFRNLIVLNLMRDQIRGDKKHRIQFKNKGDALAHAELLKVKIKNEGRRFQISQEQQLDAEKALKLLNHLE